MNKKTPDTNIERTNPFPGFEEEVLDFWDKAKTFERSVEKKAPKGEYVFYDGPPFGTGEPHYGHILSSVSKDVVPRYWTMRGYRVERRWGWDCHGLPIENIIETDMGISGKKQIEEIGIDKFNEACRSRVLEYADIWDKMVRRIARWVDFKNSYKTMDLTYMESVWWAFKELWDKDLVYEGRRVLLYCPRCETPISNFEVAMDNSYKNITELSAYVKFRVKKDSGGNRDIRAYAQDGNLYILAWTTTPWTLPGNVALAVGPKLGYVLIEHGKEKYILAKERLDMIDGQYKIISSYQGSDLEGIEYEALFEVPALRSMGKKAWYIAPADFVTTEDGTGVVHTAVVYGEDDYNLGIKLDLPIVPALNEKGIFNETVPQFKGVYFKKADKLILADLKERGLLYKAVDYEHSYPHCHRCDTQLLYNAIPAWFISIEKIRKRMLKLNDKINWYPAHLKDGRFRQGVEQAPDWNISRNRYFATPMPIWRCVSCGETEIIGSIADLKSRSGSAEIDDIHMHKIDHLTWNCANCDNKMRRVSEVFDCWVESGSMSFAQHHYPFENKEKFESGYPAQYISEYISQTRAWFYVMHAMATALFDKQSFENVVTTGVILNGKGEKMSKSKKNYPDPWEMINEFGVDALRLYLMGSPLMHADNLFFNERELRDIFRKNVMILWNVYTFYSMFSGTKVFSAEQPKSANVLDGWIRARLNVLIGQVTANMDNYDMPRSVRAISEFIDVLSTWYVRRSRDRFKSDHAGIKSEAVGTLAYVLMELSKVIAPFMPFLSERIWQLVSGNNFKDNTKSVHLEDWPKTGKFDQADLDRMEEVRRIVELGLKKRDEVKLKVRQPLRSLRVKGKTSPIAGRKEYYDLVTDEVNVKELIFEAGEAEAVELDLELDQDLIEEGLKRELVRAVNALRKSAGLTINDTVSLSVETEDRTILNVLGKYGEDIKRETLSREIFTKTKESELIIKEMKLSGKKVLIGLLK